MVHYVQFAERISEGNGILNSEWKETRTSRSVRYDKDGNTVSTIHTNPEFMEVKTHKSSREAKYAKEREQWANAEKKKKERQKQDEEILTMLKPT